MLEPWRLRAGVAVDVAVILAIATRRARETSPRLASRDGGNQIPSDLALARFSFLDHRVFTMGSPGMDGSSIVEGSAP